MTRLIRTHLTPIALVLLALLPAAMGVAPGMVRCEHPGADTHLAAADHHAAGDKATADPCCGHTSPSAPDAPADDPPCNDSPLEIDLAPTQAKAGFDPPDAPVLPVPAWVGAEQASLDATTPLAFYDPGPPALSARLAVVETTVLRL